MPICQVSTNVAKDKLPKDIELALSKELASILGKPVSYVAVQFTPDQILAFGNDSKKPCCLVSLISLGSFDTKKATTALTDFFNKNLGVEAGRMYLMFSDWKAANLGHNGNTFG